MMHCMMRSESSNYKLGRLDKVLVLKFVLTRTDPDTEFKMVRGRTIKSVIIWGRHKNFKDQLFRSWDMRKKIKSKGFYPHPLVRDTSCTARLVFSQFLWDCWKQTNKSTKDFWFYLARHKGTKERPLISLSSGQKERFIPTKWKEELKLRAS